MNKQNLNAFLKLGYFLDFSNNRINFDFSSKMDLSNATKIDLISLGSNLLQESINTNFDSNQSHLVPISGGLDSRAILAGLLECTEAKNIHTFTFGQPGSYDFEIGSLLAKELGTKHTSFNLKDELWELEELIRTAERFNYQTNLFYHPNTSKIISEYSGMNYWSGFMGDPIAGSHLDLEESSCVEDVKSKFIKKNSFVKSVDLNSCNSDALFPLIEINPELNDVLTLTENIDFTNRQLKYIAPHVLFKGLTCKLPFLDKNWSTFMLSLDNEFRLDTKLYKEMLTSLYPGLFSYPVKDNYGLPLNAGSSSLMIKKFKHRVKSKIGQFHSNYNNPFTNYLDFNAEIRNNGTLKKNILNLTQDLKQRHIVDWIDIDKLWSNQLKHNINHADALITLASLEINLKAGKKI